MKIVIVGIGKIGNILTKNLVNEGHDIVCIDENKEVVEKVLASYDVKAMYGNGATFGVLKDAGVSNAKLLIACTKSDEINLICCMLARTLGVQHTIARIREPEYALQFEELHEKLNISFMLNPEDECAKEIVRLLKFPNASRVETFASDKAECLEFKVVPDSAIIGLTPKEIVEKYEARFVMCSVVRAGKLHIPRGTFKIKENDKITIFAKPGDLISFLKKINVIQDQVKTTLIIGGGRTSYYLAKRLNNNGTRVKIIEKEKAKCLSLAEKLNNISVVYGNGTDPNMLEEEGINEVDAFVGLTGLDEQNIMLCMHAKNLGVSTVIPKVNNEVFMDILKSTNITTMVTPKKVATERVLRYVRAISVKEGSNILTLYKIADDLAEALEFNVNENIKFVNKKIKDISFKKEILVASLIRGNDTIIASGEEEILPNDRIVVIAPQLQVEELEDVLD